MFKALHVLRHPGIQRTREVVASKFVWPSMNADVVKWARQCCSCQRSKVARHTVPPIGEFQVPACRFTYIYADLVTLPTSNGFSHLLTVVDRFTRWPSAILIQDILAEKVVDTLAQNWIAA